MLRIPAAENKQIVFEMIDDRALVPTVYHYTNAAGLLGIVSSRSFRATDMAYLNDSSEFAYGLKEMELLLRQVDSSAEPSQDLDRVSQFKRFLFDSVFPDLRDRFILGVTCFCEEGDLLSQWRGYGTDSAGGYAIGFDAVKLRSFLSRAAIPLYPVTYDSGVYEHALRKRLSSWNGFFNQVRSQKDDTGQELTYQKLTESMGVLFRDTLETCSQIKDPSFKEEKEWRIGALEAPSGDAVDYVAGSMGIRPVVSIKLDDLTELLPITDVIVGPGAEQDLRIAAVERFLVKVGYTESPTPGSPPSVSVRKSSIPFRLM